MTRALSAVRRALVAVVASIVAGLVRAGDRVRPVEWRYVTELLSMVPGVSGCLLRGEVLNRVGGACGAGSVVHHGTVINDRRTVIGDDVWIGTKSYVEYAEIDDHVLIGPHTVLLAGRRHHRSDHTEVPIKSQGNVPLDRLHIGEGAWIGAGATVMADVGRHAIVGAGAVVVDPVSDYEVVAGNPARVIRVRTGGDGGGDG